MKFLVTYDGQLKLTLVGVPIDEFLKSSTWKLKMPGVKRRVATIEGQDILFSPELSYSECQSVLESLSGASKGSYEVEVGPTFEDYKEKEDSLIREKSRVGLLIKNHDDSVLDQLRTFARVVDVYMVRTLRDRQVWDAFFMCSMRKSANFSVPGSGKTASTLGMFVYLHHLKKVNRLVVVCPKNAFGSWRDEWKNCFGSNIPCVSLCFHDPEYATRSTSIKRKELVWNYKRYDLILVNYEALLNYQDELRNIIADDAMLVFDEVHKVKKVDGVRAKSALAIARDANYVVALTGTPIPNSYEDIFNLLNILYPDDYGTFFGFTPKSLKDPSPTEIACINASLQPFFCRTNKESLGVPPVSPDMEVDVTASSAETALFYRLKDIYKNDLLALIIRVLQMESDPEMLFDALDPVEFDGVIDLDGSIDGPDVDAYDTDLHSIVDACGPTTKTLRCIDLATSLLNKGKPLIIWCFFKKTMYNLAYMLEDKGFHGAVINGSTPQNERDAILASFKAGGIDFLITNPHTLAESVSLHSVCHDAIYFEYGYNLVHLLQSKDRIHRLGLPDGQYTQYYFMQTYYPSKTDEWSLDKKIYDRLSEKESMMLEAIDRGVLEPGSTDKQDIALVLEGLFDLEEDA